MTPPEQPEPTTSVQSLFVEHLPALRGFVLSLVSDFSLVDDVVQETFLVVTRKASEYQPGSNFRAWAWAIARYKLLQILERNAREREQLSADVIDALCAHEAAENWPGESLLAHLRQCIEELAPRAREAVELRYQQSHRPGEIARRMGWSIDAVHVALSRARVFLKHCVQRRMNQA